MIVNKAKCKNCKQVLHSKYRHDFVECACRKATNNLVSRFCNALEKYEREGGNITKHAAACAFMEVVGHGIFIDGGPYYQRAGGNPDDFEAIGDD